MPALATAPAPTAAPPNRQAPGSKLKICELSNFKLLDLSQTGSFSGYASVFGNVDDQGEVVVKGAFIDSLNSFFVDGFGALSHNWQNLPVATISDCHEDDYGLFIKADFHSTAAAQDCRTVIRERLERGKSVKMSIGYFVLDFYDQTNVRYLTKLRLFEVSVVTVPANPLAAITDVKSLLPSQQKSGIISLALFRDWQPGRAAIICGNRAGLTSVLAAIKAGQLPSFVSMTNIGGAAIVEFTTAGTTSAEMITLQSWTLAQKTRATVRMI